MSKNIYESPRVIDFWLSILECNFFWKVLFTNMTKSFVQNIWQFFSKFYTKTFWWHQYHQLLSHKVDTCLQNDFSDKTYNMTKLLLTLVKILQKFYFEKTKIPTFKVYIHRPDCGVSLSYTFNHYVKWMIVLKTKNI